MIGRASDVLCGPAALNLRKGIPFEAMTGPTVFIDDLLTEILLSFPSLSANARRSVHSPRYHLIFTLIVNRQAWLT